MWTPTAAHDLTLYVLYFQREHKHIFALYVFALCHWYDSGNWNPSSSKTRAYLFHIVNNMAADVLATQGARASATMILTKVNRGNSVRARERFVGGVHSFTRIPTVDSPALVKKSIIRIYSESIHNIAKHNNRRIVWIIWWHVRFAYRFDLCWLLQNKLSFTCYKGNGYVQKGGDEKVFIWWSEFVWNVRCSVRNPRAPHCPYKLLTLWKQVIEMTLYRSIAAIGNQ